MADIEYSTRASVRTNHLPDALSGVPLSKLRVGDYHVILDWRRDDDVFLVRRIGHRRNVYDGQSTDPRRC